jgi:hypothetical protein
MHGFVCTFSRSQEKLDLGILGLALYLHYNKYITYVVIMIILFSSSSCIVSPEIQAEEELFYPPEIKLNSLYPPEDGITMVDSECAKITFKVGRVRDQNIDDYLYVRWVMDWDPEVEYEDFVKVKNATIWPEGREERIGHSKELEYVWNKVEWHDTFPEEIHVLKVIVADRELAQKKGIHFVDEPPEGAEGQYDTWQWGIQFGMTGYCDEFLLKY